MPFSPASRVNYFDGQFIRLSDLTDEQAYHLALRRRHNLSHHTWGIVVGLEIVAEQDGRPAVRAGIAVDGYGRELARPEPYVVSRDLFDRYGTSRLDLWLEYQLELADDRLAPRACGDADQQRSTRAAEIAQLVFTRGGARPDPRRPPGVPAEALEEPLLATPDDPRRRWPVYLGRVIMALTATGAPVFEIDTTDRVYAGLVGEVIDHPGSAARLELGRRRGDTDERILGDEMITYSGDAKRDFAIFVPGDDAPLEPTLAVTDDGTQIRGSATVHGSLILDGAALKFPDAGTTSAAPTDGQPALYRVKASGVDELRIDMGSLADGDRRFVLGVTKDGQFHAALTISYPTGIPSSPLVVVHGDLHVEGAIDADDMRTRTVSEDVAALLTGMAQAGLATP